MPVSPFALVANWHPDTLSSMALTLEEEEEEEPLRLLDASSRTTDSRDSVRTRVDVPRHTDISGTVVERG